MRRVDLIRQARSIPDVDGTFGKFSVDGGKLDFVSGELPWRDNATGLSCVPLGSYVCKVVQSPAHGTVYELQGVKDRTHCQIHSANFCGDKLKGKKCELLGCIAIGSRVWDLQGQRAVSGSRDAIKSFMDYMGGEDFTLNITQGKDAT